MQEQNNKKGQIQSDQIYNDHACKGTNFEKNVTGNLIEGKICNPRFLIQLPEVTFNSKGVTDLNNMSEIARIFYSTSKAQKRNSPRKTGPESISDILPRVLIGIVKLKQQKSNYSGKYLLQKPVCPKD